MCAGFLSRRTLVEVIFEVIRTLEPVIILENIQMRREGLFQYSTALLFLDLNFYKERKVWEVFWVLQVLHLICVKCISYAHPLHFAGKLAALKFKSKTWYFCRLFCKITQKKQAQNKWLFSFYQNLQYHLVWKNIYKIVGVVVGR